VIFIKLWIDDVRPAPDGYVWAKSVNEAIVLIKNSEHEVSKYCTIACCERNKGNETGFYEKIDEGSKLLIEFIDIDHDAGDYASDGGDYIKLLDWLEETDRHYPIRIHSMNVVGRQNMLAICERNGWKVIP
jgi:hypothetical protein